MNNKMNIVCSYYNFGICYMKIDNEYVFSLAQKVIGNTGAGAKIQQFRGARELEYLF